MATIIMLILFLAVFASFGIFALIFFKRSHVAFALDLGHYKSTSYKDLLSCQMEMQEFTYAHISREIHDNINLSLTLSKLYLNTIDWTKGQSSAEKQVRASVDLISKTLQDLNQLSKSLSCDFISANGLVTACELEVERIQQTKLYDIRLQKRGHRVCLAGDRELMILRILQEALHNIIKHANASSIRIKLHFYTKSILLIVSDNGKGFETSRGFESFGGSGLQNMKNRVILLGGLMSVRSVPAYGTSLKFKIPINYGT